MTRHARDISTPANLFAAIRQTGARALASGALEFTETREDLLEDGGIRFSVRTLSEPRQKPDPAAPGRNVFLPVEPDLLVGDWTSTHLCVLNKYPVVPHHALLVTREFEAQTDPLTRNDFEAAWRALIAVDGLLFYNAGELAGASQPHRHLQLLPAPVGEGPARTPIDAVLATARFTEQIGRVASLPFHHGVARIRNERASTSELVQILHGLYLKMARAFACDRKESPYNLLLTRDWMLFIPRRRSHWKLIPVNALGFAGALLAKNDEQRDRLRKEGPLAALRHVGIEF